MGANLIVEVDGEIFRGGVDRKIYLGRPGNLIDGLTADNADYLLEIEISTLATVLRNATQIKKLAKDAKRRLTTEDLESTEGEAPRAPIRN